MSTPIGRAMPQFFSKEISWTCPYCKLNHVGCVTQDSPRFLNVDCNDEKAANGCGKEVVLRMNVKLTVSVTVFKVIEPEE